MVLLKNDGKQAIDEVVQVYLSAPNSGISSPIEKLVAFKRVRLQPLSSETVSIDIPAGQLQTITEDGSSKLLKSQYTITISFIIRISKTFNVSVHVLVDLTQLSIQHSDPVQKKFNVIHSSVCCSESFKFSIERLNNSPELRILPFFNLVEP